MESSPGITPTARWERHLCKDWREKLMSEGGGGGEERKCSREEKHCLRYYRQGKAVCAYQHLFSNYQFGLLQQKKKEKTLSSLPILHRSELLLFNFFLTACSDSFPSFKSTPLTTPFRKSVRQAQCWSVAQSTQFGGGWRGRQRWCVYVCVSGYPGPA